MQSTATTGTAISGNIQAAKEDGTPVDEKEEAKTPNNSK